MQRALENLKDCLRSGHVYRRKDLLPWSKSVDRHLQQLVSQGELRKLGPGLYYRPAQSAFGSVPPDDDALVHSFLKDDRYLLISPNFYNSLGLGTTQLHTSMVVYNHKRHGRFKLGNRFFDFKMKHHFPSKVTEEFLLVDLLNHLDDLPEDRLAVLDRAQERLRSVDTKKFRWALKKYGSLKTRHFFQGAIIPNVA